MNQARSSKEIGQGPVGKRLRHSSGRGQDTRVKKVRRDTRVMGACHRGFGAYCVLQLLGLAFEALHLCSSVGAGLS